MRPTPRAFRRATVTVLLAALAAPAARTATLEPEVHADVSYSDNVYYAPEAEAATPDWYARLALLLPLRGEGPRNRWELSYAPSILRYREVTTLDHDEHRVQVAAESVSGRETSYALGAGWERSQTQGDTTSTAAGDLFLVPRSDLDTYRASASLRRGQGARFVWNAELRGSASDHTPIEDLGSGLPIGVLEDRREYEAVAGLERLLSRATEVGLEYRFRRYELDVSGNENNHMFSFTTSRRLSEKTSVDVRLGIFRRNLAPAAAVETPGDSTDTGLQAAVGLEHAARRGRLHVEGSHGPSSGGAFVGTSTDTVVGVQWGGDRADRFRWDTSARWAMRDPTLQGDPTLRSLGAGAGVEWFPRRQVGLRLRADWVRQSGNEATAQSGSFAAATLGVGWYPRGATSRRGTGRR